MGERFGSYQIERRLGAGGMAEVFRAHKTGPQGFNKPVALKRMLPAYSASKEVLTMFQGEARLAAHLTHPHITALHDFGSIDGTWYMAMELVDGMDLRSILTALEMHAQPMPTNLVLQIAIDLASALEYAHGLRVDGAMAQIIHRDVTPSNVLISVDGTVKLSDFGIARAITNEHRTRTGIVRGKAPYMAPEQARGLEIDHRVDLFALGVVLYECLALRRPYDGQTELDTLQRICRGEHKPIGMLAVHAPDGLLELVESLISALVTRPSSAAEVLEMLEPMTPPIGARRALGQLVQSLRDTSFDGLEARRSTISIEESRHAKPSEPPPPTRINSSSLTVPYPDAGPSELPDNRVQSIVGMPGVEAAGQREPSSAIPLTAMHDPNPSNSIPVTVMHGSSETPLFFGATSPDPAAHPNPNIGQSNAHHSIGGIPPTGITQRPNRAPQGFEPPSGPLTPPPSYPVRAWLFGLVLLFALGTASAALVLRSSWSGVHLSRSELSNSSTPETSSDGAPETQSTENARPDSTHSGVSAIESTTRPNPAESDQVATSDSGNAGSEAPVGEPSTREQAAAQIADSQSGSADSQAGSPTLDAHSGDSTAPETSSIPTSVARIDHSVAQVEQSSRRTLESRSSRNQRSFARARRRHSQSHDTNSANRVQTSIRVAVLPFGDVLIDGQSIGSSPITHPVDPGTHEVVAIRGDSRQEREVHVESGERELVIFRFVTPR